MITLYDTRTKTKQPLPTTSSPIRIFVCGPTVYDDSHIGHARTYIFFDVFVAYLRSQSYQVNYLQNITDIDDKIINRALENNEPFADLAERYTQKYKQDMQMLGITQVDTYAPATQYIQEIQDQIKILIQKEYAYIRPSGVYYRTQRFQKYGELSGQIQTDLLSQHTDDTPHTSDKEHPSDFVIWKTSKPNEPWWESPWGKGRPGWHIEDTAITQKIFGDSQYEVHGGAQDLIFPHHEAEIALMESTYDTHPMVQIWMHTGFLNVQNEKMSKSLKNFITIEQALTTQSSHTLRLFFLQHHYRSPINYSENDLQSTHALQQRLQEWLHRIKTYQNITSNTEDPTTHQHIANFNEALKDDFHTPKALASLLDLVSHTHIQMDNNTLSPATQQQVISFIENINNIFLFWQPLQKTPPHITKLAQKREDLRQQKKFQEADEVRKHIEDMGYIIQDTPTGVSIQKKT